MGPVNTTAQERRIERSNDARRKGENRRATRKTVQSSVEEDSLFAAGIKAVPGSWRRRVPRGNATVFAAAPKGFKEWKSSRTFAYRHPIERERDELRRIEPPRARATM